MMSSQWEIQGKTFLISGGGSGLGAADAEAFLREGAKNVALLDIAEEVGKATTDRLNNAYPNKVHFIKCDMSDEESISRAFDEVVDKYKKLDVIINNAGLMNDSPEYWRKACDVNWRGLVSLTMKGLKHMRKDEGGAGGTIVNVSSEVALKTVQSLPVYSGTKSAVLHFSRCLAAEQFYEQKGIRILTVCYGATDTPLLHNLSQRGYDEISGRELQRIGDQTAENFQKIESAVKGFIEMFKNGTNGSIWCIINDKPAKDITSVIDAAYEEIHKAALS